jgi:hypothetical protein
LIGKEHTTGRITATGNRLALCVNEYARDIVI